MKEERRHAAVEEKRRQRLEEEKVLENHCIILCHHCEYIKRLFSIIVKKILKANHTFSKKWRAFVRGWTYRINSWKTIKRTFLSNEMLSRMRLSLCAFQARCEAVIRRTMERSLRTRPKANRWSWGGTLPASTSHNNGKHTHTHTPVHRMINMVILYEIMENKKILSYQMMMLVV